MRLLIKGGSYLGLLVVAAALIRGRLLLAFLRYFNFKAINTLSKTKYQKCKLNTLYRIPSLLEPPTTTTMTTTTPETVTVSLTTKDLIDDYGKESDSPTTTVSTMTVLPTPPTTPMPPIEEAKRILKFLQNKIQFLEEKKR